MARPYVVGATCLRGHVIASSTWLVPLGGDGDGSLVCLGCQRDIAALFAGGRYGALVVNDVDDHDYFPARESEQERYDDR